MKCDQKKAIRFIGCMPNRAGKGSWTIVLVSLVSLTIVGAFTAWSLLRSGPGALENLPDDGSLQPKRQAAASYPPQDLENLPTDAALKIGGLVAPDETIADATMFQIGQTKRIGNLRVVPVAIEDRTLYAFANETPDDKIETGPVLVLRLKVKNESTNQTFHPLDPAFLYPDPTKQMKSKDLFDGRGLTYTFLHPQEAVVKVIPSFDLKWSSHSIEGQEYPSLAPGEEAELIVVSDADAPQRVKTPMVWRVKLRKGLTSSGQGVATVIGVCFEPGQVKKVVEAGASE